MEALAGPAFGAEAAREAASVLPEDGVDAAKAERLTHAAEVCRVAVRVNDRGEWVSMQVDPGGSIEQALVRARVDLNNPNRAMFCGQLPF